MCQYSCQLWTIPEQLHHIRRLSYGRFWGRTHCTFLNEFNLFNHVVNSWVSLTKRGQSYWIHRLQSYQCHRFVMGNLVLLSLCVGIASWISRREASKSTSARSHPQPAVVIGIQRRDFVGCHMSGFAHERVFYNYPNETLLIMVSSYVGWLLIVVHSHRNRLGICLFVNSEAWMKFHKWVWDSNLNILNHHIDNLI